MDRAIDILLVEDSMADAEMTIYALSENHLANKVLHVKDGKQALDFLFAEGDYLNMERTYMPRLMLLDLKMPKVGGLEVLQKVRADERTRTIPVVVLTSSKEDPDIKKCYDLGVNSYIVKPVDFDDFQKVISGLGLYWLIVNQPPF